jgi:hypothetical protein
MGGDLHGDRVWCVWVYGRPYGPVSHRIYSIYQRPGRVGGHLLPSPRWTWCSHENPLSTPLNYIETRPRSSCPYCPSQDTLGPPSGPSLLAHHSLASSQFPPRPTKDTFVSYLTPTLYLSLSLLLWTPPPSGIFPLPHLSSPIPIGQPKFTWSTDSCTTCYPFVHGLFTALMMEAVRTSERSVNFNMTTWC